MSALLQTIKDAQLAARKARDQVTALSLTTLIGEITTKAKGDGNREVTDKDCIKLLTTFRDNAFANAKLFDDRGDDVAFEAARVETILYETFLPAAKPQLSEDALNRSVRSIIANRIAADGTKPKMGVVIGDLKMLHDGQYDGKVAAGVVKTELASMPEIM